MNVLTHLGQAAAVILLLQFIVLLLVILAVAGGLAYGLHWVNAKVEPGLDKAETLEKTAAQRVSVALDYAAKPVIITVATVERGKATLEAIKKRAREAHEATTRH